MPYIYNLSLQTAVFTKTLNGVMIGVKDLA